MAHSLERQKGQAAGSMESLEELMRRYYAPVCRFAYSILGDLDDAEDAAQDTFVRVAKGQPDFRGESSYKTWIYAIALNVCRAELRKRRTRAALQKALVWAHILQSSDARPENSAVIDEGQDDLRKVVDSLDEKHRLPVILRYVHNLTVPEIAAILNTAEGTIHSRLHYAREKIALRLGEQFSESSNPDSGLKEASK